MAARILSPPMPVEQPVTLSLGGCELATVQLTPDCLQDWATGWLFAQGLIDSPAQLQELKVAAGGDRLEVTLRPRQAAPAPPPLPLQPHLPIARARIATWMQRMRRRSLRYTQSGGIHAAAAVLLPTEAMLVREDIGRHNAVDKVIGACLRQGWPPSHLILLTSGRISQEMCARLCRFGALVGVSRSAATDQACALAAAHGIDLVGYVRGGAHMTLYTAGHRIGP